MKPGKIALRAAFGMVLLVGFAGSAASAATSSKSSTTAQQAAVTGGGSVQGYASASVLAEGTIVELTGAKANTVDPATQAKAQQMYGVVVDPHQLSLTISDSSLSNEAYVATSGTYEVLVSTQAGAIKEGDYVTMSSIDGVAMDAGTSGTTVFGRAAGNFDGKSNSIDTATLKNSAGATQSVNLGLVPVAINIQRNPDEISTKANLPKALQRIGQAVAEKPIGPLRIYLSIAITGLCVIVALVVLYSGIRNSVISIGRNPLSKKSIFRGLLEIVLTAFLILIIGLFAVYLLLKL